METSLNMANAGAQAETKSSYVVDTSFVLFFLAVDFGQNLGSFAFDTIFLGITLIAVAALPYLLSTDEKTGFGRWMIGRGVIVGFALFSGVIFKQSLGVVLPETFSFLPMTLLIITAMVMCYIQFYSFFNLRLSK
ncbi:MAG: hypothetical protein HKN25_00710 [Pyrinomonadaceae bacterium]|nr:hypothetical protein [Pyrinomonadaceae bacterium]